MTISNLNTHALLLLVLQDPDNATIKDFLQNTLGVSPPYM